MITPAPGSYVLKDFHGSSHRQLAAWVRELPAGSRLLELGPGTGQVARLSGRDDLHWVGLEGSLEGLAPLAERFAGGAIVDLEILDRLPRNFDAALAADVLEHLVDPDRTLAQLAAKLPSGAPLLVSVPNVANLTVRLALLLGRFEYAERGILDRTHRVFLTRRTFERRLAAAGFRVERRAVSTLPLRLALPGWPGWLLTPAEALLAGLTRLMPTLLGYQLLALARRA
jgi:SAM-dependent methyltransferase